MDRNTHPLWWELSDRLEPWTRKIVQKGLGVSRWLHLCHLTVIMEPKMGCELERFALLCYVGSTHPMDENRVLCFVSMRKAFSTSSGILRATCPVDRCFPTVCLWYNVPRASMFEDKRCDVSLGLEPSLRAGSLYVCGIIKVGRNAAAFLGNAADKRRMRTALGSVHGIMFPGPLCLRTNHAGSPWAWRNWLSAGALSRRFGVFKLTCRL